MGGREGQRGALVEGIAADGRHADGRLVRASEVQPLKALCRWMSHSAC